VILRRRVSQVSGSAERDVALQMVDEVLQARTELGISKAPEILTADTGYGSAEFVADVLERGLTPHIPLLSSGSAEPPVEYQRRTFDLVRLQKRQEKIRCSEACNLVRSLYATAGYQISRKLRIRSEHLFAEAKNEHGLGRARVRGVRRIRIQVELTGIIQNLKRLANHISRRRTQPGRAALDCVVGVCGPDSAVWFAVVSRATLLGRFFSETALATLDPLSAT
jgi:hypothetical protein